MSNKNKAALVALAGVAAVGAGKATEQLIRYTMRERKKRKLREWYQAEWEKVEEYADIGVDRYITGIRQPVDGTPGREVSRRELRWLREKAREVIIADERAQLTRRYGIDLYDLNRKQAYSEQCRARDLMIAASDAAKEIRAKGYLADALQLPLEIKAPD